MRILIAFCFFQIWVVSFSQDLPIALPALIPPSPEVGKLTEAGKLSTGLHTGSSRISIPLFSISKNNAKVEIALSYNSNGIKVDDIPSKVGLGWNLIAGGVVNRTIRNEPDGDIGHLQPPQNLYNKNGELLSYLSTATNPAGGFDTEWDEYSYSFNGISGRFFLDENGNGYPMPYNNFKIKVHGHNTNSKYVEITTGDGVKYIFGLFSKEKTKSISVIGGNNGQVNKNSPYETAWFLDQIITPEGGIINFNYSQIEIYTKVGNFQTLIKPFLIGNPPCFDNANLTCNYSESSGTNTIEYFTRVLNSIYTEDISISFSYANRSDISGDKQLTQIIISANSDFGANIIKRFGFEYQTPSTNNNSTNKRFFLTRIKQLQPNGDPGNSIDHTFQYDDINGMPERLSFAQDWYGYFNGKTNNAYYAPFIADISNLVQGGTNGGDRNPGTLAQMRKGILTSISYPTGGIESYEYEPHTICTNIGTPTVSISSVSGSGTGSNSPWVHNSSPFLSNSEQQAKIFLNCQKSPAFPDAPSGEGDMIFKVNVKKVANGEIVFTRHYYYYVAEEFNINLLANTQYYIELTIWGEVNSGSANLHYNQGTNYAFENKVVGGLRVKSIAAFDPLTQKTTYKYFRYSNSNDFSKSSGVGPLFPINHVLYQSGPFVCYLGQINAYILKCTNYMVSANSLSPMYFFGGSNVGYGSVLVADDPDFKNGFTQHEFYTSYPGIANPNIVMGSTPLHSPTFLDTDLNGIEYRTTIFKKMNSGSFKEIKKIEHSHTISQGIQHNKQSLIVRNRFVDILGPTPPTETNFEGFDLVKYYYSSKWIQNAGSVETTYDENGENPLSVTRVLQYGNLTHLQPTHESVTNSKQSTLVKQFKYPIDFAQSSPINVYQKMVNQHMIEKQIETKKFDPMGNVLETILIEYKDWYNDGKVIYPEILKTKFKGNVNWDERMRYYGYDLKANLLEVGLNGDKRQTYIWGYNSQFPVAKVDNASLGQVAYTSFEDNNKGLWTYSGTSQADGQAYSGDRVYNLNTGNITKSIPIAGDYKVTYWSRGTNANVNGSTFVSSQTFYGWKYYEHTLSLSVNSMVTVSSGSSLIIDELRIFPKGSEMNSFTYSPHIGLSAQVAPNNQAARFKYDLFGRLYETRNRSNQILEQYLYKYQEPIGYSLSTSPNWIPTGIVRCKQVPPNNNYNGEQEREERDNNSNSATYLQYRYIVIGTSSTCNPIANCSGIDKRLINTPPLRNRRKGDDL